MYPGSYNISINTMPTVHRVLKNRRVQSLLIEEQSAWDKWMAAYKHTLYDPRAYAVWLEVYRELRECLAPCPIIGGRDLVIEEIHRQYETQ